MKRAAIAAAFGALILATGCQSKDQTGGAASPAATAAQGNTAVSSAGAAGTPSPSPTVSPIPSPSPSPSPSPAATAPVKSYKVSKNYDIVPIDPNSGAPNKVVLLTFDDGPKEKEMLSSLLDSLDKHKAKAIFFVNGYRVKQNPDLLKLIHERGQTIGNHSWDHIDLKKESNAKIDQQVNDVQMKVKELTGITPRFFRPPFGSGNDYLREKIKQDNMVYMTWSNGSLDWETKTNDKPKEVLDNVMKQLHPGSNILMHELQWTAEVLDKLLTELEAKGYSFVDPAAIE